MCLIGREGIFLEKTAAFYLAEIILALEFLHNLGKEKRGSEFKILLCFVWYHTKGFNSSFVTILH